MTKRPTTAADAARVLNNNGHDAVAEGERVMSRQAGSSAARTDVTAETLGRTQSGYEQSVKS